MGDKKLYKELVFFWFIVVLATHLMVRFSSWPFLRDYSGIFSALLMIYLPHFSRRSKEALLSLDLNWNKFYLSFKDVLLVSFIIFPLSFIVNHFYQTFLGRYYVSGLFLHSFLNHGLYQILVVALPEEYFFRSYLQENLNSCWTKKWMIKGISFGPALFITSLVFALSHSLIYFQWWHGFIFFPSLVFGLLYEKRKTITASVIFHALCNLFSAWVFQHYR
ncbi:MAG: hypothetical protein A3G32_10140 [Deltaproteobacteria bacterium RIFCSPLOWO2_12_FULL_40_28]|nr:MAG: hypothetical protein A3C45_05150 [Deltaproteobacteria bacterium RIFCSPHIGHO2_02_FULL_40_28]OGQ20388.1 MAG: hypothetical protein A3E27_00530 [Deltaproteobacteria bacterium RIFCSPHIGHO2_12_FULL_40_32]OGQ41357.1 MAG: hypothetical protein A3I69_02180 [Deltaproteobacteria bacterium RIFCSPLOWO2_02_FULL_40_36]OGQ54996.1 MAG: hypothetical protein A3G32_10140 [Deltaproteobacteria bacterium RIFCSPLOWO2_12_FULL_40_28]